MKLLYAMNTLSYEDIIENNILTNDFSRRNNDIICLLFVRPTTESGTKILRSLNYYHFSSGEKIDFYLPGYYTDSSQKYTHEDSPVKVADENWYYSDEAFVKIKEHLENESRWEYSGESELLILKYTNGNLNFEQGIVFKLDQMMRDGVIVSYDNFFESFFKLFNNEQDLNKISNILGKKTATVTLIDEIMSKLPLNIGKLCKREKYFCVLNLENNK